MGTGADRGIPQIAQTDLVRNEWSAINGIIDAVCDLIPYKGGKTGNTDVNGYATITHGLGFTPSRVLVTSNQDAGTKAGIVIAVDNIAGTTFRVRFATMVHQAGSNYYIAIAATLAYDIDWLAVK